ncbi:MAG: hypothetical protein HOO97_11310 [Sideroxydans sp.]|nr:hypothetical protein [Sideroxydans sp.]
MERLIFLPFAIAVMAYPFHLSYFGFAVVAGFGIILVDFFRGKNESFEPTFGLLLLLIGIIFLVVAFYICNSLGITFEALDHDKTFPKLVRRLPYFGIVFLTMGIVIVAKSVIHK